MSAELRIYEFVTQEPKGDRDPHRHPCSRFHVVLVNGDKRVTLFNKSQFDPQWCTIQGTREQLHRVALEYANSVADVLSVPIVDVHETRLEARIIALEAEVKAKQEELDRLRGKQG
jgi:hypothetical protein